MISRAHRPPPLRPGGYSLFEMMVVLAIVMILFTVAATGFRKSWESQEIKASALHLAHDITLAAQTAQKLNTTVTLRFIKYFPKAVAADKPHYHAFQLLIQDPDSPIPKLKGLYELQTLEGTTLISENTRFSSVLYAPAQKRGGTDEDLGIGDYEYFSIEFRPNGSTNLLPSPQPATITLIPARSVDSLGELPKEYQTLVLHPENGTVSVY